ncbi:MAG: TauD/TfdA family dioxygenase [Xenococcaceae cyanobacterium MO_188.B32]|nr:TauD/TfdA family dioxygenase [Xenococcaceae cyanobacterium MO_188.B32]
MQCLEHPVLDINKFTLPAKFLTEISWLAQEISENRMNDWSAIQSRLKTIVQEKIPRLEELGIQIVQRLNSEQGFVIVKGLSFHLYKRPIADYLYLSLAAHLGKFTVHSNSKNVIWDVTPRPLLNQRKPTFSELDAEAPLHIDSAFRHKPEEYFGLFAIKSAKEGGNSIIVKANDLIQSLQSSSFGVQCLRILREQNFPFQVPSAFVGAGKSNIILAPIVADKPLIRFRLDTIEASFKCYPELATPARLWALGYFERFIKSYENKIEFKLTDGDMVFVNNHKVLHGRTAFSQNDRLLLRVRIEQNSQDTSEIQNLNQKMKVIA